MEQFRMVMAIVLSCLVFIGYNFFFTEKKEQKPVQQESGLQNVNPAPQAEKRGEDKRMDADSSPIASVPGGSASLVANPGRVIRIEGPLYTVQLDTRGAVVKSIQLREYRETVDKSSPPKELISKENRLGMLQLGLEENSLPGLPGAVFASDVLQERIVLSDQPVEIPFVWVSEQGVTVEKRYRFSPASYLIGLDITLLNQSEKAIQDSVTLSLLNNTSAGSDQYAFEGPSAFINGKLEQIDTDDIKEKNLYNGKIRWVSILDRYFMASIIPKESGEAGMHLSLVGPGLLEARWVAPPDLLSPQQKKTLSFDVYFGPKKISILKSFENGLDRAVDFGWFDFIARPCLWIMNYIHQIIPNYGVAIIILTILIKVILWPLGQKSYKSMNQMKRMQPLMTEIREKYKNDKRKMNEETMALYRTYKVNPMGGCLPMVAQIPVFFAFYKMLYEAVELRHAPFLGWVNDLSAPDRLFHINVSSIPFMEPPYGIPVLTIVMGATMFIQQKMQPPMGDPTQAKMMMFMPVIFTVIFINFSSGLVLYWLVNNILSIAQQYLVSKKTA